MVNLHSAKAIAAVLEREWSRSVSTDSVERYCKRANDPLPHKRLMRGLCAIEADIVAWAHRQFVHIRDARG